MARVCIYVMQHRVLSASLGAQPAAMGARPGVCQPTCLPYHTPRLLAHIWRMLPWCVPPGRRLDTHARCALPADFFYSMLNLRLPVALAMMAAAYLFSFLLWALIWHGVYWCAALAPTG